MATPDVRKQITLPAGALPRQVRCFLKVVAGVDQDAFAYVSSTSLGGTTEFTPDNTGLLTLPALTPTVDAAAEPLPGLSPPGWVYKLTTRFPDKSEIVEFFNVPDVAGPVNLEDWLTFEPASLPPSGVDVVIGQQLPGAVDTALDGYGVAGEVTGELGSTVVGPAIERVANKGEAEGYLGLDAAADVVMPASTLNTSSDLVGGVIREAAGVHVDQTVTMTRGAIATTVAAGSNGVNVATWTGSGVLNVADTHDCSATGIVIATTSGERAVASYTGFTGTSFTGLTLISGNGTLSTGAGVSTRTTEDSVFGSPVLVQLNQIVNYDAGNPLGGPRAHTGVPLPGGYEFPRAPVQIEGTIQMGVDVSTVLGIGPFGPQNNVVVTHMPGTTPKLTMGIGFINAPTCYADGEDIVYVDRIESFGEPGGEQCWDIGYWTGSAHYGLNGGTISAIKAVNYVATQFIWGGAQADIVLGFAAPEVSLSGALAGVSGTGTLETQVGVTVGNYSADATLPPSKYTRATTRVGIANASTTVHVPDAQTVGAGFTVTADSTLVRLTSSAARAATTAAPVIAVPTSPWLRGQVITLVNGNTDNTRVLTFTDGATTKLALGAWQRALGSGGSLSLVYDHVKGMWCETAYSPGEFSGVDANRGTYGIMRIATATASAGSLEFTPSPFGALAGWYVNSADAQPSVSIGSASGIRLGAGGASSTDVTIARTDVGALTLTAAVTVTGQLVIPDATGATSAVNRQFGDARYLDLANATNPTAASAAFNTAVRASRVDQLAAPTGAGTYVNWANGLWINNGTPSQGGIAIQTGIVGGGVSMYANSGDTQPAAVITSALGVRFGPGGSTALDWSMSRSGVGQATIGGELLTATDPTVASALTRRAWVESSIELRSNFGNGLASGEATMPREMIASEAVQVQATGRVWLTYFTALRSETVNNISTRTGSTAAGATPTLCRMGLYSVAANGDLTLVASCANDTTLFAGTTTVYTKALSAPYAKVAGQRYAIAIIVVTGAALPTFTGQLLLAGTIALHGTAPRLVAAMSGQTDLPSSISNASAANPGGTYGRIYATVTP